MSQYPNEAPEQMNGGNGQPAQFQQPQFQPPQGQMPQYQPQVQPPQGQPPQYHYHYNQGPPPQQYNQASPPQHEDHGGHGFRAAARHLLTDMHILK